jgi:hypothetical protein
VKERRAPAGTALVLCALPLAESPRPVRRRRLPAEAMDGVRVVTRDRLLHALAVNQLLPAQAAGATSALLLCARHRAPVRPPSRCAILVGTLGVGAALGRTWLLGLIPDPRRPLFVFYLYVLRGLVARRRAGARSSR